jgi:hypothetical protein
MMMTMSKKRFECEQDLPRPIRTEIQRATTGLYFYFLPKIPPSLSPSLPPSLSLLSYIHQKYNKNSHSIITTETLLKKKERERLIFFSFSKTTKTKTNRDKKI